jgi:DNA (cytosine-5)-methyltransferase 1
MTARAGLIEAEVIGTPRDSSTADAKEAGLILDLFAGPGGWSEGLGTLGLTDIGIEFDAAACQTRAAAGHLTIRADVSQYPPERFIGRTWGLIASPPCQAFSAAGSGKGRDFLPGLLAAVHAEQWDARPDPDPKVWLVLEPGRWIDVIRPEWVAMEQVPAVLPIWQAYARTLTRWGYSAHAGVLCAADYGVPQTRDRAFLMATKGRLTWPEPTHARDPIDDLFGPAKQPWVSMAAALGWGMNRRPANTLVTRASGGGSPEACMDGGSGSRRMQQREKEMAWTPK